MPLVISARFRLGLAAKGVLLLSLGVVFGVVAARAMAKEEWHPALRVAVAAVFVLVGLFPASQSRFALLDAVLGEAIVIDGAVALHSRKSGLSFSLPNGRFGEFLRGIRGSRSSPGRRTHWFSGVGRASSSSGHANTEVRQLRTRATSAAGGVRPA